MDRVRAIARRAPRCCSSPTTSRKSSRRSTASALLRRGADCRRRTEGRGAYRGTARARVRGTAAASSTSGGYYFVAGRSTPRSRRPSSRRAPRCASKRPRHAWMLRYPAPRCRLVMLWLRQRSATCTSTCPPRRGSRETSWWSSRNRPTCRTADAAHRCRDGVLRIDVHLPAVGGRDVRMRIFTPAEELPMAGHPTIGQHVRTRIRGRRIARGRDTFVFELGVGPTPVSLQWQRRRAVVRRTTQPRPAFGAIAQEWPAFRRGDWRGARGPAQRTAAPGRLVRRAVSLRPADVAESGGLCRYRPPGAHAGVCGVRYR